VQYRLIIYGGSLFEDTELDDSDSAVGWLLGAGAEINANDSFEIFGEVRYEASDPDRDVDNAVENAKDFKYVRARGDTFLLN
jgi:opacity protein-like surface antigen